MIDFHGDMILWYDFDGVDKVHCQILSVLNIDIIQRKWRWSQRFLTVNIINVFLIVT